MIDYTKLNERIVEQAERAAKKATERCLECGAKALHIRHTQFIRSGQAMRAGNHPYCLEHAMREPDWGVNDSYTYWSEWTNE